MIARTFGRTFYVRAIWNNVHTRKQNKAPPPFCGVPVCVCVCASRSCDVSPPTIDRFDLSASRIRSGPQQLSYPAIRLRRSSCSEMQSGLYSAQHIHGKEVTDGKEKKNTHVYITNRTDGGATLFMLSSSFSPSARSLLPAHHSRPVQKRTHHSGMSLEGC
jgi:hypothetical protein